MLLSIITPTFNAGKTLRETLESVAYQIGDGMEHLLVDAASSDETLAIAAEFPHLRITSERDGGIYDGMNRGARRSLGEWLLFLQGDDWLPEGALAAYRSAIAAHPDAQMICGDCEAVRMMEGAWRTVWRVKDPGKKELSLGNIALGEPMINARLMRRDVFHRLGGFSESYSLASDRDFLLRAAADGMTQVVTAAVTYRYRWHEGSSTMNDGNALTERLFRENLAIAGKYLSLLEGADRRVILAWHDRLTVQGAMNALECWNAEGILAMAEAGFRENKLWPVLFAAEVLGALPGFVARGGKTRSRISRTGART
jgi:glycosyltransferase involved in cell wall biosynthesis